MHQGKRKIINDPVHGFITIDHPLIFKVLEHPYYQRLRRILQMALAHLVYPGAMHTRLSHSLGAYHLMRQALKELCDKGVKITEEEEVAAQLAILLHDIGHGPFSHALENIIAEDISHEEISLLIMEHMNTEMAGALDIAIAIFKGTYHKKFLHQLVSGQLDVDRMDYLSRDSFYTGVSEGVIGYDRILKMLTVHNDELMLEEKGVHSVEKFIVARRLMYWQVYLHKTVLSAENLLIRILTRAKELFLTEENLFATPALSFFMSRKTNKQTFIQDSDYLEKFCQLDDYDIFSAIKVWKNHPDSILSTLCQWMVNRKLFHLTLHNNPINKNSFNNLVSEVQQKWNLTPAETHYFVFHGTASNKTYDIHNEEINILFKDGTVKDISEVENALINTTVMIPIKKFYICHPKEL